MEYDLDHIRMEARWRLLRTALVLAMAVFILLGGYEAVKSFSEVINRPLIAAKEMIK